MALSPRTTMLGPAPCVVCRRRSGWLCDGCSRAARPPYRDLSIQGVDRVVAPWLYEGGPRSLILALKLRSARTAAGPLVEAMTGAAHRARIDADVVTWVPARTRDISRRGFDHAEVLARGVAERLGLPRDRLLQRRGVQRDQAGLDRPQRLSNLAGAFHTPGAVGERVLLVDDLVTTGATAASCAGALSGAGAAAITLLVGCQA